MKNTKTKAIGDMINIDVAGRDRNEEWGKVGEIVATGIQTEGVDEVMLPADAEHITAFALFLQDCYKAHQTFADTFLPEVDEQNHNIKVGVPGATETTNDPEQEMEEKPEVNGWEYCDECGKLAVDRTKLVACEMDYEFYCDCGHAWWGEE